MSSFIEINDLTIDDLEGKAKYSTEVEEYYSEVEYDKLPYYFENIAVWPKHTNLKCGYCTLDIPGIPLFIPMSVTSEGKIEVGPSMCNFKCILKVIERYSVNEYNNALVRLKIMHKKITGYEMENFSSNLNSLELDKFGGMLTNRAFSKRIYDEYDNKDIYYKLFANEREAMNFINSFEEI